MPSSAVDTPRALALRDLLHQSPRLFHKPTSVWTLELAAEVAYEQGWTATRVSGVTIRNTLARRGVRWRRAKEWITSPDPEYARKKARRDRLIRLAQQGLLTTAGGATAAGVLVNAALRACAGQHADLAAEPERHVSPAAALAVTAGKSAPL